VLIEGLGFGFGFGFGFGSNSYNNYGESIIN
jgi:hypothetical protein